MTVSQMSKYEQKAYAALTTPPKDSFSLIPKWVRDKGSIVSNKVQDGIERVPGHESVELVYAKASKALMDFTTGNGLHSASLEGSIKRHQKKGNAVDSSEDFLKLDLKSCDELLPNRKAAQQIAAIAEGAATSLAITGLEVSATVSGGVTAAGVIGALAVDSIVVMAGLGKVIGEVAVTYGYDPNLPEEEIFAVQVLGLGLAVEGSAKIAGLASLSKLTQEMMRHATWTQLNKHVLVDIINRAFTSLGLKLTQKKLAQIVPIAGVVVSSGMNLVLLNRVHAAAEQAYRLRFLTEKYELEAPKSTAVVLYDKANEDREEVIKLDELLIEAVEESKNPDSQA